MQPAMCPDLKYRSKPSEGDLNTLTELEDVAVLPAFGWVAHRSELECAAPASVFVSERVS